MKYIVGTDIGGTTVKLGLFEESGTLLEKWQIPTVTKDHGVAILPDIAASIAEHLTAKNIEKEDVLGVGIGVPGPVGDDGTVFKCVNLGWDVFNVEEKFVGLTGFKTKVGNDANVAALGEVWQGGGMGYSNAVMVTLGTGVGGGIVIDGKILAGANGAGGEIGHMTMDENETEVCGCGKKGCLEQYASATGLVRMAKRIKAVHPDWSEKLGDEFSAKDVCDYAEKDSDKLCMAAVEASMGILGKGMALISCVVNPQVYILGGGLSKSFDLLLPSIVKTYEENVFHAARGTKIVEAKLGNDAGIYGAAKMILG